MNNYIKPVGRLIVVSGPMAAGKDTICEAYMRNNPSVGKIMSTTTRPPRDGEIEKKSYNFISEEEYQKKAVRGDFFQSINAELLDQEGNPKIYRYANEKSDILDVLKGRVVIWQMTIDKAAQAEDIINGAFDKDIARQLQSSLVKIFIGIPRLTMLKDRAYARDPMSKKNFRGRIFTEWEKWMKFRKSFNHVVINEDLKIAIREFETIVSELILVES